MTKSDIFKKAHALARATIKAGDNYQATFALCLKAIIADSKTGVAKPAFVGTDKQVKWANDSYNRNFAIFADTIAELKNCLAKQQAVSTDTAEEMIYVLQRHLKDTTALADIARFDNLLDKMLVATSQTTAKDWIECDGDSDFDNKQFTKASKKSVVYNLTKAIVAIINNTQGA